MSGGHPPEEQAGAEAVTAQPAPAAGRRPREASRLDPLRAILASPPLAIVAVLIGAGLLAGPWGEFPIADDWAYAETVRTLIARHQLVFNGWGAMNLVSHIAWGGLAGLLFGPGYTVLRLSTACLGLVGALASYRLARQADGSGALGLLTAAVCALNPIWFLLSFSFMTDVPFAAMLLLSFALLAEGQSRARPALAALGWCVGAAALLCRQNGLALPLAWAVAGLCSTRPSGRMPRPVARWVARTLAPVVAFIALQLGYQAWLRWSGHMPHNFGNQINLLVTALHAGPIDIIRTVSLYLLIALAYLGTFLLPLTATLAAERLGARPPSERFALCGLWLASGICLALALAMNGQFFPQFSDTLSRGWGFGVEDSGVTLPPALVFALTALSSLAAILLLAVGAGAALHLARTRDQVGICAVVMAMILLAPLPFIKPHFDRYLVPIVPCLAVALVRAHRECRPGKVSLSLGGLLAIAMAATSVAATHDFLAWKRAQARAYALALTLAPPSQIDAGWVVNASRFYDRLAHLKDPGRTWHLGRQYLVQSYRPRGYRTLAAFPANRWLAPGNAIYLLQRKG